MLYSFAEQWSWWNAFSVQILSKSKQWKDLRGGLQEITEMTLQRLTRTHGNGIPLLNRIYVAWWLKFPWLLKTQTGLRPDVDLFSHMLGEVSAIPPCPSSLFSLLFLCEFEAQTWSEGSCSSESSSLMSQQLRQLSRRLRSVWTALGWETNLEALQSSSESQHVAVWRKNRETQSHIHNAPITFLTVMFQGQQVKFREGFFVELNYKWHVLPCSVKSQLHWSASLITPKLMSDFWAHTFCLNVGKSKQQLFDHMDQHQWQYLKMFADLPICALHWLQTDALMMNSLPRRRSMQGMKWKSYQAQ